MLEELRISNFAIIHSLELSLEQGLNVMTGETGAGKSIVIDAVELLMGGKTDASMVRAGADKAVIEGTFYAGDDTRPLVRPILEREELLDPDAPDVITLTREVRRNGRSSARVNGVTVNLSVLNEVGSHLVDIHGQSEHLSLLRPAAHIDLLDRYAGLMGDREQIAEMVAQLNDIRREMSILENDKDELERRADRLRHEVEEIEAAELQPGEDDELIAERKRLSNSEQLAMLTAEASILLNGDDEGDEAAAVDQLQQVAGILEKLANIDAELDEDADLANTLADQAAELALTLRSYAEEVEYDPQRIEEIEERLELINGLRRRYGLTIEIVIEHAAKARVELAAIDNSDERLDELRGKETSLLKELGSACKTVSEKRTKAGETLAKQIETELQDLRMAAARFTVNMEQADDKSGVPVGKKHLRFDATGIDDVEFMMTANPGEPMMPLAKVASGGETARIMLALKRALTLVDPTDTLIFDEIDQGIGGRLGSVVGEKLWNLSGKHQVMVVTHLAQLGAYADAHFRVEKRLINERTSTHIFRLDDDKDRTDELAAMLGTMGESGEQTARDLLAAARGYKQESRV
ncbi:MAG: DNA repair protein RecN [Chloroflexota bacterium]